MVGATVVVLLLTAGIVWRATGVEEPQIAENSRQSPNSEGPIDASTAEQPTPVDQAHIAALEAEAEFHALVARRMIAAQRHQQALDAWQKERALGDPLEQIREELDKTAFRMIARADRIIEQMGQRESAIAIYQDVIRLFPKTLSAGVAQDRLARLELPQGDT